MSKVALTGNASGTGTLTVAAPNTNSDYTLTLPELTGTIVSTDASGNVGIGTSNPETRLHVFDSGNAYSRFTTTSYTTGFDVGITSTGITQNWNRNNTDWRVATNNTESIRVTSGGNVGIGTSSPGYLLDVAGNARLNASSNPTLRFAEAGTVRGLITSSSSIGLGFETNGALPLRFVTNGSDRMLINSTGTFRIGTTTGNADAQMTIYGGSTDSSPCLELFKGSATNTTAQVFMRFQTALTGTPAASGSITANGVSSATFTAWSDRKLKENIVDLSPQLENICKLKPSEFDFIGYPEGEGHQIGFIAQDMQEVYPDVVSEGENGMLQISGWSKTEARLVKAIQEQQKIIETLEARVASLEAS